MSNKNTIIKVEDRNAISRVNFKFPDLMNEEAEQRVIAVHKEFLDAQNALYDARNKVRECEEKFEKAKAKWTAIQNVADIEFTTIEKEVVATHTNTMVFKGVGNSTLGYDTRIK